jgi:hypothetical protein
MPDSYVIEVSGRIAGIVARDSQNNSFNSYSAVPRFNAIEGRRFSEPRGAHACETREPPAAPRNGIFNGQVGTARAVEGGSGEPAIVVAVGGRGASPHAPGS